jgi:cytochrome c553
MTAAASGGALLLAAAVAAAVPAAAAPSGATSCTGCHGPAGPAPALEGRPAPELTAAMTAFRTGERPATVMGRIAKGFTEAEVKAIAEWFAARPAGGRRGQP